MIYWLFTRLIDAGLFLWLYPYVLGMIPALKPLHLECLDYWQVFGLLAFLEILHIPQYSTMELAVKKALKEFKDGGIG